MAHPWTPLQPTSGPLMFDVLADVDGSQGVTLSPDDEAPGPGDRSDRRADLDPGRRAGAGPTWAGATRHEDDAKTTHRILTWCVGRGHNQGRGRVLAYATRW